MRRTLPLALCVTLTLLAGGVSAAGDGAATTAGLTVRVKDIASLQGVNSTPLIGYGIVAGLAKTGDRRQTIFSAQTLANMLERFGVLVPGQQINIQNIAAVLVTAEMPAFVRKGGRIDAVGGVGRRCTESAGRDAAGDGAARTGWQRVCARTRSTVVGWIRRQRRRHLGDGESSDRGTRAEWRAGRERTADGVADAGSGDVPAAISPTSPARTGWRMRSMRTSVLDWRAAVDAGSVTIKVPSMYKASLPSLMARLEPLPVTVDAPARVVINERTGTVVIGVERAARRRRGRARQSVGEDQHEIQRVAADAVLAGRSDDGDA